MPQQGPPPLMTGAERTLRRTPSAAVLALSSSKTFNGNPTRDVDDPTTFRLSTVLKGTAPPIWTAPTQILEQDGVGQCLLDARTWALGLKIDIVALPLVRTQSGALLVMRPIMDYDAALDRCYEAELDPSVCSPVQPGREGDSGRRWIGTRRRRSTCSTPSSA